MGTWFCGSFICEILRTSGKPFNEKKNCWKGITQNREQSIILSNFSGLRIILFATSRYFPSVYRFLFVSGTLWTTSQKNSRIPTSRMFFSVSNPHYWIRCLQKQTIHCGLLVELTSLCCTTQTEICDRVFRSFYFVAFNCSLWAVHTGSCATKCAQFLKSKYYHV